MADLVGRKAHGASPPLPVAALEQFEQHLSGFHPLASKLRLPHPRVPVVIRGALIATLLTSEQPFVVVSAPAGSGKSILLTQWATADQRPTAWLSLDPGDNDPRVFLNYLVLALGRVMKLESEVVDMLQVREPPIRSCVLPRIADSIAAADPFLLVLDDAHRVHAPECWELIDLLLRNLPAGAQLAIGTRGHLPLPMARLRAEGALREIGEEALALQREEFEELLALQGLSVTADVVEELLERTEGWATGIALAILAGRTGGGEDPLSAVHGDRWEVAEYLLSEVLYTQPQRVRDFLLQTSILDRLCAPLCQAVTRSGDAEALLAHAVRDNLFLIGLDERGEWFRYHHLFAELLRSRLEQNAEDELQPLHEAAAVWHREHGLAEQAISHWLAAGNVSATAEPLMEVCDAYLDRGQEQSAVLLLQKFSDEQLRSDARLCVIAGFVSWCTAGDARARERILAACRVDLAAEASASSDIAHLRSTQSLLRAGFAPDGVGQMLKDATEAARLERHGPNGWRCLAQLTLGIARFFAGARHPHVPLRSVVKEAEDEGYRAQSLGWLSLIAEDAGRWNEAAELVGELEGSVQRLDATQHCPGLLDWHDLPPLGAFLPLALGRLRVLSRQDDADFDPSLAGTLKLLREMPGVDDYLFPLASLLLGEIALERGDLPGGVQWSDLAERQLRELPADAGLLRPRAQRLRLALQQRILTDPISPAEERILQLLPTRLTLEQMARTLFLSVNTVRTHVRAIYRKLGVGGRAAAVQRAQELGLLKRE